MSAGPELWPAFLKLSGRPVLLVGGGAVAAGKLSGLLSAGARVTLVAPAVRPEIEALHVTLRRRPFQPADIDGCWLVVAAAPPAVNRAVEAAAAARGVFVNAVDDPDHGSAYAGGVLRRGGVTIAVSTAGRAPALAGLLREALEVLLPPDLHDWVTLAADLRARHKRDGVDLGARRPLLLEALNRHYGDRCHGAPYGTAP